MAQMKLEIEKSQFEIVSLREWLTQIDPKTYRKEEPWRPELAQAYDAYIQLVQAMHPRKREFKTLQGRVNNSGTPEEHLECSRLAIAWGQAVQRY